MSETDIFIYIVIPSIVIILGVFVGGTIQKRKNFRLIIEPKLEEHGLRFIQIENPGMFNAGPFEKYSSNNPKKFFLESEYQYKNCYFKVVTVKKRDTTYSKVLIHIGIKDQLLNLYQN